MKTFHWKVFFATLSLPNIVRPPNVNPKNSKEAPSLLKAVPKKSPKKADHSAALIERAQLCRSVYYSRPTNQGLKIKAQKFIQITVWKSFYCRKIENLMERSIEGKLSIRELKRAQNRNLLT